MTVVSLAAMGSRLHQLEQTLRSLLAQTFQPDAILVHVSKEPYLADPGVSPRALRENVPAIEYSKGLIQVHFVTNTGPYRKLLPTLLAVSNPNTTIVTADDDVIYPDHWLARLVDHRHEPYTVSAYRCRQIAWIGKHMAPYERWRLLRSPDDDDCALVPRHTLLPTGAGGIAYRRSFFTADDPWPKLMQLAPMQDDIAIRLLMLVKDVRVRWIPSDRHAFRDAVPAHGTLGDTLYQHNERTNALGFTANDQAIRNVAGFLLPRAHTKETRELLRTAARRLPFYKALHQQARQRYWAFVE